MLKTRCRIFKSILELNALNPCDNFKFEWNNSNLTISSICRGCIDLTSRKYSIFFDVDEIPEVEDFLHSMCYKIPEYHGYFMNINSIPTENIYDRIFNALFQLSTCIPVFEYTIKYEENRLTISNVPLEAYNKVVKTIVVPFTSRETKDINEFMKVMFKHRTSTDWYMKVKYLSICA